MHHGVWGSFPARHLVLRLFVCHASRSKHRKMDPSRHYCPLRKVKPTRPHDIPPSVIPSAELENSPISALWRTVVAVVVGGGGVSGRFRRRCRCQRRRRRRRRFSRFRRRCVRHRSHRRLHRPLGRPCCRRLCRPSTPPPPRGHRTYLYCYHASGTTTVTTLLTIASAITITIL